VRATPSLVVATGMKANSTIACIAGAAIGDHRGEVPRDRIASSHAAGLAPRVTGWSVNV
jgi:hypothetical protein